MIDQDPKLDLELVRRRQRSRSLVTALLLGGFVLLTFFIAIVKIKEGQG